MKAIRTIGLLASLFVLETIEAQQLTPQKAIFLRPALTFGFDYQVLSYGGEGSEGDYAKGLFFGLPVHIAGKYKSRLVLQPDVSIFLVNGKPKSLNTVETYPYFGANVAFKYTRLSNRTRFAVGPRMGYQGTAGLFGLTMEFDYRVSPNWMVGINANTQFFPGAEIEGYSGFKLQLTKLIYK